MISKQTPLIGIICMFVSVSLFPFADACFKYLVTSYSVQQASFLRAVARLLPLLVVAFLHRPKGSFLFSNFLMKEPCVHFKRIGVNLISTYCFMGACVGGSLTLIYALGYTAPIFMVLLSSFCLKERVSKERWIAVLLGLLGVVVAIRPDGHLGKEAYVAALLILIGSFFAAMNKMYVRRLGENNSCLSISIYPNVAMLLCTIPAMVTGWQPMVVQDWILFLSVGGVLGLSQLLVAYALKCAQPSLLAPIDYSTFLWVMILDALFWNKMPDSWTTIGAIIIIFSNLWIIVRNRQEVAA